MPLRAVAQLRRAPQSNRNRSSGPARAAASGSSSAQLRLLLPKNVILLRYRERSSLHCARQGADQRFPISSRAPGWYTSAVSDYAATSRFHQTPGWRDPRDRREEPQKIGSVRYDFTLHSWALPQGAILFRLAFRRKRRLLSYWGSQPMAA